MMMSLLEECRGGKQGRGVREHHTGEKDKVRRGKPMGHKAAGFPGCFLVILFVAIGLTLSLKANADTDQKMLVLSITPSFIDATKQLRELITNDKIASEDLPIHVVTSGASGYQSEQRRDDVASTFGVFADQIICIEDVATQLGVDDPYNTDGSWRIPALYLGSKLDVTIPPEASAAATFPAVAELESVTLDRDIFVVAISDVLLPPSGVWKTVMHKLLERLINIGLQKVTPKQGTITVHTIGTTLGDMVAAGPSKNIWFRANEGMKKAEWMTLEMVHGSNNVTAKTMFTKHSRKSSSASFQKLPCSSRKANGATEQPEYKAVKFEDLCITKLKDRLSMKPVWFDWTPVDTTPTREFLTSCLERCNSFSREMWSESTGNRNNSEQLCMERIRMP
eukprot:GHVS01008898.1.p1 GENE.GHVS01008898.1~~GHVS01008898.1.p1  ORF type:complete len:394 (-),score=42.60 GHVS01008898.1:522-1703(-)